MLENSPWPQIAISFSIATVVISVFQICQHLRNYTEPSFQRFIIRIIFLVPSYSVASCLALLYRDHSIYYETPRDCYEAWVIYNFMSLCMAYIGGPGAVVVKCEGKVLQPSWVLMTCCMKPIPVDGFFLRRCKQGTLQFVIIKPILAILTLVLFSMGRYQVGNWSYADGYPYITFIYNICYALALFWLLLLYVGTDELLKPYKPLLKFACFKAVIFLTFWQSLMISFAAPHLKIDPDNAEALQNWVIVAEMLLASIGMLFAFPWSEYQIGGTARGWSWEAFIHAVSIMDVVTDILHQFNPSYGSYLLYDDGGPAKNVKMKKYRGGEKKAERNIDKEEFSAATSAATLQPKRQGRTKSLGTFNDEEMGGNEDGALWYGGQDKPNIVNRFLARGQDLAELGQNTGQQVLSWIPGITEQERNQAELLDSDSDAALDEDNVRDNQIDDDMLLEDDHHMRSGAMLGSDDDDDDEYYANNGRRSKPMSHKASALDIAGQNHEESSILRVEAAFGFAMDDSVSRVEAAFAAAFGTAPAVLPTAAVVTSPPPPAIEVVAFSPGAAVVPLLAPPTIKPTRSIGAPPAVSSASPPSVTGTKSPQEHGDQPPVESVALPSDKSKEEGGTPEQVRVNGSASQSTGVISKAHDECDTTDNSSPEKYSAASQAEGRNDSTESVEPVVEVVALPAGGIPAESSSIDP